VTGFPWQVPAAWQDRMRRDELETERELEREAAERHARAELAVERAVHAEKVFLYEHGCTPGEYHSAVAQFQAGREARPPGAEYGSEDRPAVFVGDTEVAPRPEKPARRTADHHMVVPGQDPAGRAFMLRMIAERDERAEIARREAAAAEIAGLEREVRENWGEISRSGSWL
jgi:hypothetical protein